MIDERYLAMFQAERGEKATKQVALFLSHWNAFQPASADTPAKLDDFRTSLRACGRAPSSCNRILGSTKAYLRWLCRRGETKLTRDDITEGLRRYKEDKPQPQVLTVAEIKAMLTTAATTTHRSAQRWRVYTILGLTLGCRHGELCSLSAANVDLAAREVRIWATKTGVERRVPIHESPSAVQLLERLCKVRPDRPFIGRLERRSWHSFRELAGVRRVPRKVLRSTAAAYIASGTKGSEYLLSARFGHGTSVAIAHYRQPIHGIEGTIIEEWMGAVDEFKLATDAACGYRYRK